MSTAVTPDQCANCANCEAPLTGHYCANCGQEAVLHHASTREFLHEFIGHYVALEGKLWGSLVRLLFRPGLLTNEYMRGRRVRFVQPLRLYLSFSVLFFALLKFSGTHLEVGGGDAELTTSKAVAPARALADKAAEQQAKLAPLDPEAARSKQAAEAAIAEMVKEVGPGPENAPSGQRMPKVIQDDEHDKPNIRDEYFDEKLSNWPTLRHQWHAFNELPGEQQWKAIENGLSHYAPYAIFCLMPVFAMFLKVLYLGSGRRFGEHVLFALHTNAFAFFIFGVMLVLPYGPLRFALFCWLVGYLPWAMRRVYHSSRFGTLWRWSVLMICYQIALVLALTATGAMGILTVGH
jgi:hypothetical protein